MSQVKKKPARKARQWVYYATPFYNAQVCCRTCRTGENVMVEDVWGRRYVPRKKPVRPKESK